MIMVQSIDRRKAKAIALVILTAVPFLLWGVINIDSGVMLDNQPVLLWVHAPSTITPSEDAHVLIEAWDQFERVSSVYNGRVSFSLRSYDLATLERIPTNDVDADLPSPYQFTGQLIGQGVMPAWLLWGGDNGMHSFDFSVSTEGIHYLLVNDSLTERTYWSNPIVVDDSSQRLVWGDVHSHSILSDGSGLPHTLYYYAQHIAGLEFCSITDHGEILNIESGFGQAEAAANAANSPNQFVALQGVEWTSSGGPHTPAWGYGHLTFVFSGDECPRIAADIQESADDLWAELDSWTEVSGDRAIAIPHHSVRLPFIQDWAACLGHPEYMRLAEAYSVHGSSLVNPHSPWNVTGTVKQPPERIPGSSISEAIRMGLRLGLMANGDSHGGHVGHSLTHTRAFIGHQYPYAYDPSRVPQPYPSGLTGAFVEQLTRPAVFDALYQRRMIANSDYGRPYVRFAINGVEPGDGNSTVVVSNLTDLREIEVFLAQEGSPPAGYKHAAVPWNEDDAWDTTIQVFKNGQLWAEAPVDGPLARLTLNDTEPVVGAEYNECFERDGDWYINNHSLTAVNPEQLNTSGQDYYFVRIIQHGMRFTAVGPLWIRIEA
jgi:hypothetical protein